MKKITLLITVFCLAGILSAQNVQLHYDFGENRKMLTSTVEMFKPDKFGNTFLFTDFDYGSDDGIIGVSLAYFEIARVIKTEKMPIGFHVEYDGGFGQFRAIPFNGAYRINDAFLTGIDYSMNASDFSKGFSIKALYKYIDAKHDASFQLTGVWYWNFLDGKLSFSGFADFWREDFQFVDDAGNVTDTKFVFLAEPQLWYNTCKNFAVGSEIEISSNFGGNEGFMVNPTLAIKYIFD